MRITLNRCSKDPLSATAGIGECDGVIWIACDRINVHARGCRLMVGANHPLWDTDISPGLRLAMHSDFDVLHTFTYTSILGTPLFTSMWGVWGLLPVDLCGSDEEAYCRQLCRDLNAYAGHYYRRQYTSWRRDIGEDYV